MKQIKYIALLAMALTFFLGQTNVAFSQAPPACHSPSFTGYQNLLTTVDKYGYCWSWNGVYGPTPPSVPNPPPCPGMFMCITSLSEEATSCGTCTGGDSPRGGKFFHFRNMTGALFPDNTRNPPITRPPAVISYVDITGTTIGSVNGANPLAEICYAKRNFGASDSPNNWWLSYDLHTGSYNAVTPANCFTPTTWVDGSGNTVFTVRLQCAQTGSPLHDDAAYLIDYGNHLTSVIWGMNTITEVVIHYTDATAFTINNPTVNTTRCPDGSASDCP